jgi:hypothetical protein
MSKTLPNGIRIEQLDEENFPFGMKEMRKNHFLILGVPRSGTTLLERLLDNHSQIAVCPESDVFTSLYRTSWRGRFVSNWHYHQFMTYLTGWLKEFNDPALMVAQRYWQEHKTHHGPVQELLKTLVIQYLAQKQKTVFGEKSPRNNYRVKLICRLFPEIKLIRIIRHPYDVVCSIMKLLEGQFVTYSQDELLLRAASFVKIGAQAWSIRPLAAAQNYYLKYEDLIEDPPAVLTEICAFLGLDYEKSMLEVEVSDYLTNPAKKSIVHPNLGQAINPDNKNKYRQQLSEQQQQMLFRFFGSELASLPYQIVDKKARLDFRQHLLIRKHRLLFQLKYHFWEDEIIRLKLLVKSLIHWVKYGNKKRP